MFLYRREQMGGARYRDPAQYSVSQHHDPKNRRTHDAAGLGFDIRRINY